MNKHERTIVIEKYLDGELQDNDLVKFELEIQNDKELKEDLFLHREIRKVLSDKDVFDLRLKLNAIRKNYQTEKKYLRKKKPVLIYTILSVIVITVISFVFVFNHKLTNDELFEKYYKQYRSEIITQSAEKSTDEIYTNALRIYDKNQFKQAIEMFNLISDTSQYFTSKEYFTGLSYMELKNYYEAVKHFKTVLNSKPGLIEEDAIWYSALCYLKTNQNQQAIKQLRFLQNSNSEYKKHVDDILENLDERSVE
ncbi:MAG: hypothetical protein A2046_16945 [Bacteroidetes bacterium GWA2_30_7]|nr:MAG: hypothetical protein A2046_16945 [Bacteroidetes bacterium GWA2_30_7]